MSYRLRPITIALLALAVEACLPSVAGAQVRRGAAVLGGAEFRQDGDEGAAAAGKAVYVRDSATVVERLALADRLGKGGGWDKAADVLQEVLEKQADKLLPLPAGEGEPKDVRRYVGVAHAVQDRMAAWPPEGRAAYRARTEPAAAALLESAGNDPEALNRLLALYYHTDAGRTAAVRLIDLRLEAGEFAAAAWAAERLLATHPDLPATDRAGVLFRAGLAHHLGGATAAADDALKQLRGRHAGDVGTVAGREVAWADALASAVTTPPPAAAATAGVRSDRWPTLGGNDARAAVSAAVGRPGAKLFGVDYAAPRYREMPPRQRPALLARDQEDRATGAASGVVPVADRNELFFQDGRRVYAVALDSGRPLPGWDKTYPGGRYALGAASGGGVPWGWPRGQQLTLTVADDAVFAVMGQPDGQAQEMGILPSDTRLVCLDRATGAQRWAAQLATTDAAAAADANWRQLQNRGVVNDAPAAGGDPDPATPGTAVNKSLQLAGAPLVVGDGVYVIGRTDRQQNFEDSYLVCLDRATGKTRWACYLAGASGNLGYSEPVAGPLNASHPAAAGGRIFVCTDLGAVAAVDAFTGNVVWLTTYPRNPAVDPAAAMMNARMNLAGVYAARSPAGSKPWTHNPVVVRDGRVFVLPPDGLHLLVYDAGTGAEVKRVPLAPLKNPDTLLGVVGDRVLMTGDEQNRQQAIGFLTAVDWRTVDSTRPEPAWVKSLPSPGGGSSGIRGRGFVAGDVAYVPTEAKLFAIDARRDGMAVEHDYPHNRGTWSTDGDAEAPGNVLVVGEHVVVAGPRRVDVYTDLDLARARRDRAVAAAPDDPGPRIDYFDVLLPAGEVPAAIAKLDEAIELLGGRDRMTAGPARDRVYAAALAAAVKLSGPGEARPQAPQWAAALFDRAAAAAATPAQHVNYRVARAAMLGSRSRDYASVVRLYQEILHDPQMRLVPVADDDDAAIGAGSGGPRPAGAVAEQTIADLIRAHGRRVYVAFDLVASEKLAAAQASRDPAVLLDLARTFPNAMAAPQALLAAADAYEAAGDTRMATQVLKELNLKAPEGPARTAVLEGLARNYLARPGGAEKAVQFLSRGSARLDEEPAVLSRELPLPGGATLPAGTPFKQAAGAIAALPTARTAAQQLPDFKIRQWRKGVTQLTSGGAVPGVAQIVVPAKPHARTDRVVTWSPRVGVRVFRAADAKQLCARPEMPEPPRGAAWVGDDVLVWSGTTLLRIAPEQDKVVWSMTIAGLPPVEPVVPPDGGLTVASVAGDGEDVGIDNGPGIVNGPVGIVRPQQFRAARNRMNALALMRQQQIEADRIAAAAAQGPEQWVAVRPVGDRVVASTSSGRLAGVDAAGGALAWQVRLADRAPDRLLTNDDFVVARVPGDAGSHVVAVDAYSGRPLGRRPFGNDTTPGPINLALADDGTLVYTLADRVGTKNLFDPWADGWRFPEPDAGAAYAFGGAARADQLVVGGGRIAALAGDGRNVHVFSLFTLRPVGSPLATGAEEAVVGLTLLGDRLYAVGPRKAKSFDLGGADEVLSELRLPESATIAESFVGQDHVVLLDTMGRVRQPDASQDRYRLLAYSRRLVEGGRESKALELSREIADDGILPTWHAVDGGFYYLTAGGVMKQVKGTGE